MYVEPINASGDGDGISWYGASGQRSFGRETELRGCGKIPGSHRR